MLSGLDDDALALAFVEYWHASVDPDAYWALQDQLHRWDLTGALGSVTAPTLVVHCRHNGFYPAAAQRIAASVPNATLLVTDSFRLETYLDRLRDFLLGDAAPRAATAAAVRAVLFTDVVGHAAMMARLGDARGRGGAVAGFADAAAPGDLRAVLDCVDAAPLLPADLLELCRWTACYYLAPLAEVIATIVPGRLPDPAEERIVALARRLDAAEEEALARKAPGRARAHPCSPPPPCARWCRAGSSSRAGRPAPASRRRPGPSSRRSP